MIQKYIAGKLVDLKTTKLFSKKRYNDEQVATSDLECFNKHLQAYLKMILENRDAIEEWTKNAFKDFLKASLYSDFDSSHFNVGTDGNPIDLMIWDKKYADTIGVIFEIKSQKNKSQFPTITKNLNINLNAKAMHEALLYFSREKLLGKNIYYICITNGRELYLFDAKQFEILFKLGKQNIPQYINNQTFFNKTADFYDLAKGLIDKASLDFLYIDLSQFQNKDISKKKEREDIQNLYKILHRRHLLKDYVRTTSTGINKEFYKELLHILGIKEDDKGVLILDDRIANSMISQILNEISSKDYLEYKNTFDISLELAMVWVNRLLFLKLLEDQMLFCDPSNFRKFLDNTNLKTFSDLNSLFFDVFNKPKANRNSSNHNDLPYLNSSLFSIHALEQEIGTISTVQNQKIPLYKNSILYDFLDKGISSLPLLEYVLSFINSYQFGVQNIQNLEKELIDHNILGSVFEKINGFKDGSVFTPAHLCEYMVEEAINQSILSKINEKLHMSLKSLEEINYNDMSIHTQLDRKTIKAHINEMINGLKIVDPAVGTGHFLTSVITYILHLKSKLGLYDQSLADYQIHLENNDIAIRHRDTQRIYVYTKASPNHVQRFIFEEKKQIIENLLHGVDINPLSVELCKLRLWIELLKHSYYDDSKELVVLPNLETKIRQGNSLLHRLKFYRDNNHFYPQIKQAILKIKQSNHELFNCNDKAIAHQIRKEIQENRDYLLTREEIKIPVPNAFYWQIDFPHLVDIGGGFDIVIGNPPYISMQKLKEFSLLFKKVKKSALNLSYETYEATGDIYCLFYELGYDLLKEQGILSYITSNKFMRAGYGSKLRSFLSKKVQVQNLIDLGSAMFDKATVDTCILSFKKEKPTEGQMAKACDLSKDDVKDLKTHLKHWITWNPPNKNTPEALFGSEDTWNILDDAGKSIKKKIENVGKPLKEWKDIKIYRGIVTGFDEAFIINDETKQSILDQCVDAEERQRTSIFFKKILRGKDIKRFMNVWDEGWIINLKFGFTRSLDLDFTKEISFQMMNRYPSLFNHFQKFLEPMQKRSDQGQFWWELRSCEYMKEFEKPKIVYQEICQNSSFFYDDQCFFIHASSFCLIGYQHLKFMTALLNSKILTYAFKEFYGVDLGATGFRYKKIYIENLPVLCKCDQTLIEEIEHIVDTIQSLKKDNKDTIQMEKKLDQIIYNLYQLDTQEIAYIETHLNQ